VAYNIDNMKQSKNETNCSGKLLMKRICQRWGHRVFVLSAIAACGLATAGVIPGTGTAPSANQLGTTDAVKFTVAESGPGHALVVPYFTAQNGQMSVLHLVNTDLNNGKAVKLRYRGAGNADTLLDFVVLLSPGDVWTGAVNAGSDGKAQITADKSCTSPSIPSQGQPFSTWRLNPNWTPAVQANNTREGYIEAIVMADIPSTAAYGAGNSTRSSLYTAIRHINGVAPCTQSVIDAAMLTDTSDEAVAASRGFATPTGGLMGTWYIIDVPGSTTFSGSATAFTAVNSSGQSARGNYVLFPQSDEAVAQPERFTADPLLVAAGLAGRSKTVDGVLSHLTTAPVLQAQFSDLPDLSTPYYLAPSALNARRTAGDLTQTLAVKSVKNQYATEPWISAKTDWVFSMPTMRYSVAYDYAATGTTRRTVYSLISPRDSSAQYFSNSNVSNNESQLWTKQFRNLRFVFNREGLGIERLGVQCASLCLPPLLWSAGMVSVMSLDAGFGSALRASVTSRTSSVYNSFSGWINISTEDPDTQLGLPLLGASFIKLTNPAAQPGVSGNYGITWPHGYTR
jgi:hypothetical protein